MVEIDEAVPRSFLPHMKFLPPEPENEESDLLRAEELKLSDIQGSIVYGRRLSKIRKSIFQNAQQCISQMAQQSISQMAQQSACQISQQSISQNAQQSFSQIAEQSVSQNAKQSVSQIAKQSVSQIAQQSVSQIAKQSVSQIAEQSVSQITEQSVSQIAEQSVSQIAEQSVSQIAEQSVSQIAEQSVSQIAEQSVSQITEQSISHIAQDPPPPQEIEESKQVRKSIVIRNSIDKSQWKVPPRYQMKREIASGTYGCVMEAFDTKTQTTVAIKRIRSLFKSPQMAKMTLREMALLNLLKGSENVVEILDICVPDDLNFFDEIYLVLEYAFTDLRIILCSDIYGDMEEEFRVEEGLIQSILYGILTGLRVLHSAGIIHRDLKPENCLVTDTDVQISDLGLSRTLHADDLRRDAQPYASKKRLTTKVVTRWYRAPELLLLEPTYCEAIDIWSVGCIFAELLGLLEKDEDKKGLLFPHSDELLKNSCSDLEQLSAILTVLGRSEEQIASVEKESIRRLLKQMSIPNQTKIFENRFANAPELAVDLLRKMLEFDQKKRFSVDECLSHPYLAPVINEKQKRTMIDARFQFNDWEDLDEFELRFHILNEIKKHHPEIKIPKGLIKG